MPSTPRSPSVLRQRVTMRILLAASDQVLVAHQLGDRRRDFRREARSSAGQVGCRWWRRRGSTRGTRPTVQPRKRAKRGRDRARRGSAGSPRRRPGRSGDDRRSPASVRSARTSLAATRSRSVAAARPASWSPDFSSLALANTSRRSAKAKPLAANRCRQVHERLLDPRASGNDSRYPSDSRIGPRARESGGCWSIMEASRGRTEAQREKSRPRR